MELNNQWIPFTTIEFDTNVVLDPVGNPTVFIPILQRIPIQLKRVSVMNITCKFLSPGRLLSKTIPISQVGVNVYTYMP
jgi:hypothetical protein